MQGAAGRSGRSNGTTSASGAFGACGAGSRSRRVFREWWRFSGERVGLAWAVGIFEIEPGDCAVQTAGRSGGARAALQGDGELGKQGVEESRLIDAVRGELWAEAKRKVSGVDAGHARQNIGRGGRGQRRVIEVALGQADEVGGKVATLLRIGPRFDAFMERAAHGDADLECFIFGGIHGPKVRNGGKRAKN